VNIKKKARRVCVGDMVDLITLQNRQLQTNLSDVDLDEAFSTHEVVWSMVETISGETIFDGVGIERDVTHRVYIYHDAAVTEETWILFGTERLDIITVENLDERGQFMLLRCTNRGSSALAAGDA